MVVGVAPPSALPASLAAPDGCGGCPALSVACFSLGVAFLLGLVAVPGIVPSPWPLVERGCNTG